MKRIITITVATALLVGGSLAAKFVPKDEATDLFKSNLEALAQTEEDHQYLFSQVVTYCQHQNSNGFPCLGEIVYCLQWGNLKSCSSHGCNKNHF